MIVITAVISIFFLSLMLDFLNKKINEKKIWHQWNEIHEKLENDKQLYFGKILNIRQHARSGTKAYIQWYKGKSCPAIWIKGIKLKNGEYILVNGSRGPGSHHGEEVFYVRELHARLPFYSESAWRNYNKKLKKQKANIINC